MTSLYQNTCINFEKISTDPSMSAITQQTASKLLKNPYMTLADFFKGLTHSDLVSLSFMAEAFMSNEDSGEMMRNLIILTLMLSVAEGAVASSDDEVFKNVQYFCLIVTAEHLRRKGFVNIMYENLSFGAEMNDAPFIELRPGVDPADYIP